MAAIFNAQPDGSLKYKDPFPLKTNLWRHRNGDLRHVEPIVPACRFRRIELRTLNCGQTRADWFCDKLNTKVSVKDCNQCQIHEPTPITESPMMGTGETPIP